MGHRNLENQQHQAVDGLQNLFSKANRDLSMVHNKLHKEFQQVYPDHANPMKLVSRVKKIEEEMSSLKDQCRELLAAKQDLIDKARTILVGNRLIVQRLQASTGAPVTSECDDPAYVSFNQQATKIEVARLACMGVPRHKAFFFGALYQIIDEWTTHVRSRTEDEMGVSPSDDINRLLFSAIVQGD